MAGHTAILPCSVDFLGPFKVVWQDYRGKLLTFEDRRIISDERISLERPYVKEWNLHIRLVRPSDDGNYTCQVNSNPVQVNPVVLNVHVPPQIMDDVSSPPTVVVQEGQTVELVCNVTGVPPPTVVWYRIPTGLMAREDGAVQDNMDKKQIGVAGEVLVIHNVTRYCDDVYECVAHNDVADAARRRIRVYVEFPPEVRLPNRKIGQARGKTTILECVVTAYPHAISIWKRHGKDIDRNSKYNLEVYDEDDNTLTLALRIQAITDDDYGQYKCVSENKLGKDSETMTLYEYPLVERTLAPVTPTSFTPTTSTRRTHNSLNNSTTDKRTGGRGGNWWAKPAVSSGEGGLLDTYTNGDGEGNSYSDKQFGRQHTRPPHPDTEFLERRKNPWQGPVIVQPGSRGATRCAPSLQTVCCVLWVIAALVSGS